MNLNDAIPVVQFSALLLMGFLHASPQWRENNK